jgi:hypothetical protein
MNVPVLFSLAYPESFPYTFLVLQVLVTNSFSLSYFYFLRYFILHMRRFSRETFQESFKGPRIGDLAKWLGRLTASVKVATVQSSIPSSHTVESEGWQMKQC